MKPTPRSKLFSADGKYRLEIVLLTGLTLVAAALRFYKLGEWGYWIDEIYTLQRATTFFERSIDQWQVSTVLIGLFTSFFGASEYTARFVPAILGIFSIPVLYLPIRKMFGATAALIASLFLAISPWHVYWSQNVRFYTALLLFYNLALFAFYFGFRERRIGQLSLSFVFLVLAAWERLMAFFFVPVVGGFIFWLTWRSRTLGDRGHKEIPRRSTLFTALILILGVVIVFVGQTTTVRSFFEIFVGNPNHSIFRLIASISFSLTVPLVVAGLTAAVFVFRRKEDAEIFIALGAIIPLALLVLLSPFVFTVDRYIFLTLPSWAILGAIFVKECAVALRNPQKVLVVGILALLTGGLLAEDFLYYRYYNGYRPKWREAISLLESQHEAGDIIVTTWPELVRHYLGDNRNIVGVERFHSHFQEWSEARLWLIEDSKLSFDAGLIWADRESELIESFDVTLPGKTMKLRIRLIFP